MIKFFPGYTARSAYEGGVGSRIVDREAFEASLAQAVEAFDFSAARTPGQGFLPMPEAVGFVSAGVGPKSGNVEDHVLRSWRGDVKAFLKREHAVTAETLAVVVYQGPAFLAALDGPDTPEAVAVAEREAFLASGATHAVVAVLAGAGPEALSPGRLVSNLAGGNKDALSWTADEIRQKATEALAYSKEWSVVSD
jgi:hypothetical protein